MNNIYLTPVKFNSRLTIALIMYSRWSIGLDHGKPLRFNLKSNSATFW